jgi:hypothetical protein
MSRGKVLIVDCQIQRGQEVATRLRNEGYEPLLFRDSRLAFAHAYRVSEELTAAVIECDDGREQTCVSALRLMLPDLPIFAGMGSRHRLGHARAAAEPRSEPVACRA